MIGGFIQGMMGGRGDAGQGGFAPPAGYDSTMPGAGEGGMPQQYATYDRMLTGARRDLNINDR